jgi:hypothetical protein
LSRESLNIGIYVARWSSNINIFKPLKWLEYQMIICGISCHFEALWVVILPFQARNVSDLLLVHHRAAPSNLCRDAPHDTPDITKHFK